MSQEGSYSYSDDQLVTSPPNSTQPISLAGLAVELPTIGAHAGGPGHRLRVAHGDRDRRGIVFDLGWIARHSLSPHLVYLGSINAHGWRRTDTNPNLLSADRRDDNANVAIDDNFFVEAAGQYQHGYPSLVQTSATGQRSTYSTTVVVPNLVYSVQSHQLASVHLIRSGTHMTSWDKCHNRQFRPIFAPLRIGEVILGEVKGYQFHSVFLSF